MGKFSKSHHIKIRQSDAVWRKRLRKYRVDPVISQPYYFVNSIIQIYSRSGPICSFVGPFLTTYRPNRLVLVMMKFTLVNSIIRIYSRSGPICSFFGPFLTTYRPNRLVLVMMKFTLVNSIIRIYSQFGPICSFVGPFLTTYSPESCGFGNDEIHISEFHHMDL